MKAISRYVSCVAIPLGIITFVVTFWYSLLHSSSSSILQCPGIMQLNGNDEYTCTGTQDDAGLALPSGDDDQAELGTKIYENCHAYFVIGGYHGEEQNSASAKWHVDKDQSGWNPGGSVEPLLVCSKDYDVWAALNQTLVILQLVWMVVMMAGPCILKRGCCGGANANDVQPTEQGV